MRLSSLEPWQRPACKQIPILFAEWEALNDFQRRAKRRIDSAVLDACREAMRQFETRILSVFDDLRPDSLQMQMTVMKSRLAEARRRSRTI